MGLLLILPILIGGYIVCLKDRALYSRLHRHEGQLLYLLVAYQGLVCFVIACLVTWVIIVASAHQWKGGCLWFARGVCWQPFTLDVIGWGAEKLDYMGGSSEPKAKLYFSLLLTGAMTLLVPFALAPLRFRFFRWRYKMDAGKAEVFANVKSVQHLPIPNALASSMLNSEPVMISMEDRKVYVGIVQSIGSATEVTGALEHFGIWPTISGYRDKDTLKVVYTYDYDPKLQVPIYFRQDNVVSVTTYNPAQESHVLSRPESCPPIDSLGGLHVPSRVFIAAIFGWLLRGRR